MQERYAWELAADVFNIHFCKHVLIDGFIFAKLRKCKFPDDKTPSQNGEITL